MKLKALLAAAVLAPSFAAGAFAADCKPAHEFTTVTKGKFTVAAYELMPYISVKDGVFGGIDSAIVKEIAKMECVEIEILSLDPAAVINAVISGKADFAAGDWYRTEARSKVLDLSAPLYLDQMGIISKGGVKKIADLDGKKVGNIQGYLWFNDVSKAFGDNAVSYNNTVNMSADLAAGRIDAGFEGYNVAKEAQKNGAYPGFTVTVAEPDERVGASKEPGQAALPYTKGNKTLGAALDADLAELHKNGKIAEILTKFGLDPSGADTGAPRLIK